MFANVITSSVGWRNLEKKEESDERVWKTRRLLLWNRGNKLELNRDGTEAVGKDQR